MAQVLARSDMNDVLANRSFAGEQANPSTIVVDGDPAAGAGTPCKQGNFAIFRNETDPSGAKWYYKTGPADTAWIEFNPTNISLGNIGIENNLITVDENQAVLGNFILTDNKSFSFTSEVTARKTAGASAFSSKKITVHGIIHKNNAVIILLDQDNTFQLPAANNIWNAFAVINGSSFDIIVAGEAGTTIKWRSFTSLTEV